VVQPTHAFGHIERQEVLLWECVMEQSSNLSSEMSQRRRESPGPTISLEGRILMTSEAPLGQYHKGSTVSEWDQLLTHRPLGDIPDPTVSNFLM
jgi:hypothetical protein